MEREKFLSAIYLIIKNEKGELLLQRRQGTKLLPGFLALPADMLIKMKTFMMLQLEKQKKN